LLGIFCFLRTYFSSTTKELVKGVTFVLEKSNKRFNLLHCSKAVGSKTNIQRRLNALVRFNNNFSRNEKYLQFDQKIYAKTVLF